MLYLVIGGSASGKSSFAENLCQRLSGNRLYIATMQPFDDECHARIARHRAMRKDKGFETLECYTNLVGVRVDPNTNALLEDLSNLTANELYSPEGNGEDAVISGLMHLTDSCKNLTVVTNEVFSGGSDYADDTLNFLRILARINIALAERADTVIEMNAGIPNILKGELPW